MPTRAERGSRSSTVRRSAPGEFHCPACKDLLTHDTAADIASATQGAVALKAYRLSQGFIDAYRAGKFDTARCAASELLSRIISPVPDFGPTYPDPA